MLNIANKFCIPQREIYSLCILPENDRVIGFALKGGGSHNIELASKEKAQELYLAICKNLEAEDIN
jgi:hypothetical protein